MMTALKSAVKRALPQWALLIFGLGCVCFVLSRETPVGTVRGIVTMKENNHPLSGAKVYLIDANASLFRGGVRNRTRIVRANGKGEFLFPRVEAGIYRISARSSSHAGGAAHDQYFTVVEGRMVTMHLAAEQTEPVFHLHQAQVMYGTRENAQIGFTGYVDDKLGAKNDRVQMRVWRMKLSEMLSLPDGTSMLNKIGRGYEHVTSLPQPLFKAPAKLQTVLNTALPLKDADEEGFFHARYKFDALKPALYLIQAQHGGNTEVTWMLVSDMALVVKRAAEQITAYTTGLQSGIPIAGAEIRTYSHGKVIHTASSDADGLATYAVPEIANTPHHERRDDADSDGDTGNNRDHDLLTVAVHGDDESVIQRSYYTSEDDGKLALFTYTDRPVYRPGQQILYRAIARKRLPMERWKNGIRYASAAGDNYHVILRDINGDKLLDSKGTLNQDGCLWGQVSLDPEAPTGVYSLITTIDGETRTHDITIASYKKPDFKVSVNPAKARYFRGETIQMVVSGEYYFGAPAAGAKVKYSVYRDEDYASYQDSSDQPAYVDSADSDMDGARGYFGAEAAQGTGTLDENGKLTIQFPAAVNPNPSGPQRERYTASVTVVEGEDNEVTEEGVAHVFSGDLQLGISSGGTLCAPGAASQIRITALTLDGKPAAGRAITIEGLNMHYDQDGIKSSRAFLHTCTTGSDGSVIDNVVPTRAGELQIRATANDDSGRQVNAQTYLWVVSGMGQDLDTSYSDLALHTDKEQYKPGDTARVLINSLEKGMSVLLTIEGDRVHMRRVVPMVAKSTVVTIPILGDYGPNIALAACYVKNKRFANSEVNLRVSMPLQQLNVSVTPDKSSCEPGEAVSYTVKTTDITGRGVPAALSLGVVDEAVYAIREDIPKALFDEFYPQRQSNVQTEYSFSIAFMGDADKSEPQMVARKRFPDTSYWNPNLHTDAAGVAHVTMHVPDTLTTWRATVVAATADTQVGRAVSKVICTKPFLVRLEAPRSLTCRDRGRLVTDVHNDTGAQQSVHVALDLGPELVRGCDRVQTIVIDAGKHAELVWPIDARDAGSARVTAKAWTDTTNQKGRPYTDAIESSLPVLPHGRLQISTGTAMIPGGTTTASAEIALTLPPTAVRNSGRLEIQLTPNAVGGILGSMEYLAGFPYGCTEQTLSRFVPDLAAVRLANAGVLPQSKLLQADRLSAMVRSGILRLGRLQNKDSGAWSWWEHGEPDAWMTAYALMGLAEAAHDSYPVPEHLLKQAQSAAQKMVTGGSVEPNIGAFLLYALAKSGNHELPVRSVQAATVTALGPEGLGWMILTCHEVGMAANRFVNALLSKSLSDDESVHWNPSITADWNESDVTATATAIMALSAVREHDDVTERGMRWLMRRRQGQSGWFCTRDTAWAVMALCAYVGRHPLSAAPAGKLTVTLNGRPLETNALINRSGAADGYQYVAHVKPETLTTGVNTLRLSRDGAGGVAYATAQLTYVQEGEDIQRIAPVFPITAHLGSAPASKGPSGGTPQAPLELSREYRRISAHQSSRGWHIDTEATNDQLNEGDHIRVRLTINAPRDMEYVLIEDPYPAGCEINEKGDVDSDTEWNEWYSSQDVRDTHIAFFARRVPAGKSVIEYNLRAKTRGSYHAMPAILQAMYSHELHAESAENRVMVR
jgi:alpha-2-macroglobulin